MCVERNSGKFEERLGFGSRVRVLGSPVNIKPPVLLSNYLIFISTS